MNFLSLSLLGHFLNLADRASCREGERLIGVMKHAFSDAVASLSLYQASRAKQAVSHRRTAGRASGVCPTYGAQRMPADLEQHLPFLHAQSFIYALDTISKVLAILSDISGIPDDVRRQKKTFSNALPSLTPLRKVRIIRRIALEA